MIRWLVGLWYAHLRRIDLAVFWPTCKEQAQDLDHAKAAFAVHAFRDAPWLWLGEDEIVRLIDGLT